MKVTNKFIKVRCNECKNEQIIFSKAASQVKCVICGATLATSTGGKAQISGTVLETF
ncbi:MAG: 30S ribosomal protein S27e [Candidatus Woesearchaeota archaeon]